MTSTLVLRALGLLRRERARAAAALDGWYPGRPLLLGHRGDRAHAPENTVASVVRGIERGANGAEFDVRLARDGVPVVIHDATVERTFEASGPVSAFTARELKELVARRHPRWGEGDRVGVPTLDELLRAMPDGAVANVELKGPAREEPGLERASVDVIEGHRARLRVIVSSFHPQQLLEVRRLDATLPLGLLVEPGQIAPLRLGLAALALEPEAIHLPAEMISRAVVERAHAAGVRVHVWRVMSAADVERLVALGVDALMVDDVPAGRRALDLALSRR